MVLWVVVVGGGFVGFFVVEILVKVGIEIYLFECKLDNVKFCGGVIFFCMVDEFDLFLEIIDCWVWKMKMIFFFNIEVNIG